MTGIELASWSFPVLLAGAVVGRVMIPLYRDHAPGNEPGSLERLRRMRLALTCGVLLVLVAMALGGEQIVRLLYDDRYLPAGAMVTLIALVQMPGVIGMTYDQAALAAGNGRGYFLLLAMRATAQTAALVIGAGQAGLVGALLGQGLAAVAVHPLIIRLARSHRVWDPLHDAVAGGLLVLSVATVLVWRWNGLLPMAN